MNDIESHNDYRNAVAKASINCDHETIYRLFNMFTGATKTGMSLVWYKNEEEALADMAKRGITMLEPEQVADTIVWLLGQESEGISGVNIPIGASVP